MAEEPFFRRGATISITAATTAPAGAQAPDSNPDNVGGAGHYRVFNAGSVIVFLASGLSASEAQTEAATLATSIPIPPGGVEILKFEKQAFFSARAASGTATVYVTPGEGI